MCSNFGNDKCKELLDLECPYCHEHLYCNKRTYANHLRWCKSNPKYEEILNSTKSKLRKQVKTYTLTCEVCGKEYQLELSENSYNKGKHKRTCSDECAKKLTAKHTNKTEKNKKISEKLQKETNIHVCKNCGKTFIKNGQRSFCSLSCFNEYKRKQTSLKLMENGKLLELYNKACSFQFSIRDFPNEFDIELLKNIGWYKAKNKGNNLNGVSRDHKVSKYYGFEHLIDPYIISHPANCKLLPHSENQSKNRYCSISVDELLNNIQEWNKIYGIYPNKIDYSVFDKLGIQFNK